MALSALRWFKAALVLQIVLLAYWLTLEVVDLHPWNDLASRPAGYDLRWSVAVNALQLLAYMALFAFGFRPLAMLSAAGYAGYLVWQLWTWWKPYALGASSDWQALYAQSYAHTLKVLPDYAGRLAPDAAHLTQQGLTLLALAATITAISRMRYL